MTRAPFDRIVSLYEKNRAPTITRHRVEHRALGFFCVRLELLDRELGELSNEDYWRTFMRPLRQLRFQLCAAPMDANHRDHRIWDIAVELREHLLLCDRVFPDFAERASLVLEALETLLHDADDPLLRKLVELTPADQEVAWVVKESRLIPGIERLTNMLSLPLFKVVHPSQLKDTACFEQLIVIGPSRWFPESIFTAVRSARIHIVIYDWIRDRWKPQPVFVQPYRSTGPSIRKRIVVEERETSSRWDDIDAEDILAFLNKTASVESTLRNEQRDEYEDVDAICVFLEGDWAVFVDASEGNTILVIDLEEDPEDRITRISPMDVQPGVFILVRIGGGGDYIVPVANEIMGKLAPKAREQQRHWKELLRDYVKTNGILKTSIDLLSLGSQIANEVNVRNWMSPRNIRTHDYADFHAIMRLIGLGEDAERYWDMMGVIDKAHRSAGFQIRNLLLEQVRDLDVEQLQKQGRMDFRLSNTDEGGITAFRIESIMYDTVRAPYSRIGQPFSLDQ